MTQPVAEIVTFRLIEGSDPQAFIKSANAIIPFLRESGAATSRALSVDEDGLWTDHIRWNSLHEAKDAASVILSRPEAAPMLSMIDPASVTLRHAGIVLDMD